MKKQIMTVLSVAAAASLLASGIAAAPAVDGRKTCEAYIADVKLDGKVDEVWKYAPEIKVDTVKQNASAWYGDTSKVAGVDYATLTCKVLWNGKDTLYLLYEVKDNTISLAGANPWEKDSIEYFVQLDNSTDSSAEKTQKRLMADNSASDIAASDYGYSETSDGFIYEIAVDVSAVGGAGQYLGIDFQYNDDAEGKGVRNVCLGWSDSVDKASSDSSVYGQCLLSDVTVADLIAAEKAAAEASKAPATADPIALLAASCAAAFAGISAFCRRK